MNPTSPPKEKPVTALPASPHERFMLRAIEIARTGLGRCAPNPSVGCVIVKDGIIIGEARSADGGRPHAETQALKLAGEQAKGADVYVTLEPCAHVGKTPSCANALVDAKVARVICACTDMDPRTAGKGLQMLREAGIEVVEGVCEEAACETHEGFFTRLSKNRPFISLKVATSLDGRVAAADGSSQWITGDAARTAVHRLRSQHDAIVTGSGTVLADNPSLTVRLEGHDGWQPKRIVLDRRGRVGAPAGWHVFSDYSSMAEAAATMAAMGLNRVMVEAGSGVAGAFLASGTVDKIYWFRAPIVLGDRGLPVFGGLDIANINQKVGFQRLSIEEMGEDLLEIYTPAR